MLVDISIQGPFPLRATSASSASEVNPPIIWSAEVLFWEFVLGKIGKK